MIPQTQPDPTQLDPRNPRYLCCCGNCHVVKGALYIGYFELVVTLLVTCATIALLIFGEQQTALAIFGVDSNQALATKNYTGIFIGAIIFGIALQFFIIVCLLVGAKKQKRYLLIPFLVITGIAIASFILRFFGSMMLFGEDAGAAISAMISVAVGLAIQVWFFFVVLRCYQYLNEASRLPAAYTAAQAQITVTYPQGQGYAQQGYVPAQPGYPQQAYPAQPGYPQAYPAQPGYPQAYPPPQDVPPPYDFPEKA